MNYSNVVRTLASAGAFTLAAGGVFAEGIADLPASEQAYYGMVDPQTPLGASPLADFAAKNPPPWKIGYASSYAGSTWRKAALDEVMNTLLPAAKEAGLVSEVVVTESDLKDAVQIQQMRQMVDDGVDAIIICCANVTALNPTIEYAHSRGVPVFSFSGYVTSPYAINVAANHMQGGYDMGKWLAEEMGAKGNVVLVSGIPGFASSDSFDLGAKKALEEYPEISVIGEIAGKWTDQVAQTELQKFLATNPQQVDGVLTQSAQENGVLNAMLQSGRDMVPITLGGEASAACYWRKNPDWISSSFHIWPPAREMGQAWDVMLRTLGGEGPKVQTMLRPVLPYTIEDVNAALPEDCDLNSTDWIQPTADQWWPADIAKQYFNNPK
ncbi:ABC transporter substrate-binding protein [Pseudotabrizicola sp. 4114]|uniref:ABC transporter substrate-binding protein n=1 Tax=Pseudotabrizicola sp. 4114 TaxID=2817731 RepID=UPI00285CC60D|nr:ribose transport system substrate-binding protein [Pseudorhodobacter sp. 4114]